MNGQKLNGSYRLHGVHDMACAFNFTPDGKFQFFQMYGAIDRKATGTYTVEGKTLKLKSDKVPGKDFNVTAQSKKGSGYTIKVNEPNDYLRKYVMAIAEVNGAKTGYSPDESGLIRIEEPIGDSIALVHELFPDFVTIIKDKDNVNNYFEVTLLPSLTDVSFKGIDFTMDGDSLTCMPNYFLPYENIEFVKE